MSKVNLTLTVKEEKMGIDSNYRDDAEIEVTEDPKHCNNLMIIIDDKKIFIAKSDIGEIIRIFNVII